MWLKQLLKSRLNKKLILDEIYYKRQDPENYFTQLVDSQKGSEPCYTLFTPISIDSSVLKILISEII